MQKVFIFGDSTAAPKRDSARPETGWGECFSKYLSASWTLDNRAINGRSTKQVLSNGEFASALSEIKEGDVALIQYGHNEGKPDEERHTEPWISFRNNLIYMAKAIRNKGAEVIFLTPISQRSFVDGLLEDTHRDYPKAMIVTAKELSIPIIDMTKVTMAVLEALGEEKSKDLFMNFPAGVYENYPEGKEDDTHLRPAGAEKVAQLVYSLLLELNVDFLKK